ncbi:DDE-type integrase/transposase/recombinase [Paenibacillus naphthalenovorans]|jgi:transposase InsO family protein|uniref:DDE-type integrase/transposase/recombinase n=1 Tax=Paenibacillus naphthalenovorans TaxID=162209 RepID=UPI00088B825A|nr:DDE-type integrase/transposase/recombinase [Paenibacillus naphthalenovorans]SDJ44352.1 Mu transposase, C-terminal [Paenibacillus naphthalenovorans]
MKKEKAEEIAAQRVQLLSPLLADGLDPAKASQIKAAISEQYGISERTLRRYLARYREAGFSGLKPKAKGRKPAIAVPESVLEQAILLRREVPGRSVRQIIQILEWEEIVKPGELKRSTLQEKLTQRGYSSRQMRLYETKGVAARRFQKRRRNALWQSDIKEGPYLPIGPGGEKKQVYLVLFEDDATRSVMNGEFYALFDQTIVEDCFRKAIQKYGVPEAVYFDQGKQYKTKWMARTCSKLGIRLLFARPYSPESKGKVERLNGVIESFLGEVELEKPKTLEQLNALFQVWLSECYQNKPHSALGGRSPEQAFRNDPHPLRFVEPDVLANAFLHCENRKVDKAGCISFMGRKYEVGLLFIGRTVQVVYDPADITEVTIEYEGHEPWKVRELVIGERAGKRPALPEQLQPKPADASRLLRGAEKQHDRRREQQTPAISFRAIRKEVADDV